MAVEYTLVPKEMIRRLLARQTLPSKPKDIDEYMFRKSETGMKKIERIPKKSRTSSHKHEYQQHLRKFIKKKKEQIKKPVRVSIANLPKIEQHTPAQFNLNDSDDLYEDAYPNAMLQPNEALNFDETGLTPQNQTLPDSPELMQQNTPKRKSAEKPKATRKTAHIDTPIRQQTQKRNVNQPKSDTFVKQIIDTYGKQLHSHILANRERYDRVLHGNFNLRKPGDEKGLAHSSVKKSCERLVAGALRKSYLVGTPPGQGYLDKLIQKDAEALKILSNAAKYMQTGSGKRGRPKANAKVIAKEKNKTKRGRPKEKPQILAPFRVERWTRRKR